MLMQDATAVSSFREERQQLSYKYDNTTPRAQTQNIGANLSPEKQQATVVGEFTGEVQSQISSSSQNYNMMGEMNRQIRQNTALLIDNKLKSLTNESSPNFRSMGEITSTVKNKIDTIYGAGSEEATAYNKMFSDLESLSPELYEKAMLLMTLFQEQGDESFIEGLKGLKRAMSGLNEALTAEAIDPLAVAVADSADTEAVKSEQFMAKFSEFEEKLNIVSGKLTVGASITVEEGRLEMTSENSGMFTLAGSSMQISVDFRRSDPLVFDLGGDGIDLRSTEEGVEFDLLGTGEKVQTSFIQDDDAFLYLDKNGNGSADNGKELFGDQEGDKNGFDKLARYDQNSDGKIDELDEVYSKLRLWQDLDGDGYNQLEESMTLIEAGIKSLDLNYSDINENDGKGNIIGQNALFTRNNGSKGMMSDMLLRYNKLA